MACIKHNLVFYVLFLMCICKHDCLFLVLFYFLLVLFFTVFNCGLFGFLFVCFLSKEGKKRYGVG